MAIKQAANSPAPSDQSSWFENAMAWEFRGKAIAEHLKMRGMINFQDPGLF
jgi:hypothetical protein